MYKCIKNYTEIYLNVPVNLVAYGLLENIKKLERKGLHPASPSDIHLITNLNITIEKEEKKQLLT